jgi:hypothetical protein
MRIGIMRYDFSESLKIEEFQRLRFQNKAQKLRRRTQNHERLKD